MAAPLRFGCQSTVRSRHSAAGNRIRRATVSSGIRASADHETAAGGETASQGDALLDGFPESSITGIAGPDSTPRRQARCTPPVKLTGPLLGLSMRNRRQFFTVVANQHRGKQVDHRANKGVVLVQFRRQTGSRQPRGIRAESPRRRRASPCASPRRPRPSPGGRVKRAPGVETRSVMPVEMRQSRSGTTASATEKDVRSRISA